MLIWLVTTNSEKDLRFMISSYNYIWIVIFILNIARNIELKIIFWDTFKVQQQNKYRTKPLNPKVNKNIDFTSYWKDANRYMIQQIEYWEYMVIECMTVKVKNRNCLSSHCVYDVLVYFRDQRRYTCICNPYMD